MVKFPSNSSTGVYIYKNTVLSGGIDVFIPITHFSVPTCVDVNIQDPTDNIYFMSIKKKSIFRTVEIYSNFFSYTDEQSSIRV